MQYLGRDKNSVLNIKEHSVAMQRFKSNSYVKPNFNLINSATCQYMIRSSYYGNENNIRTETTNVVL